MPKVRLLPIIESQEQKVMEALDDAFGEIVSDTQGGLYRRFVQALEKRLGRDAWVEVSTGDFER